MYFIQQTVTFYPNKPFKQTFFRLIMEFATIFDMDGVLVDTTKIINDSINFVLKRYELFLDDEDSKNLLGKSINDSIEYWNGKYNLSIEQESFRKYLWAEQSGHLRKIGPSRNLVDFLVDLDNHNVIKSIGTSSTRKRAKKILNWTGLRKYFPILVGAEDVPNHKPSPDIFLEAAKRMNFPPERCIVFEDAYSGIQAAKSGNMKTVGYSNGNNSITDIKDADFVIKDFSQLNYDRLYDIFG